MGIKQWFNINIVENKTLRTYYFYGTFMASICMFPFLWWWTLLVLFIMQSLLVVWIMHVEGHFAMIEMSVAAAKAQSRHKKALRKKKNA